MPSSQDVLAPSGTKARFKANLDALATLNELRESGKPATTDQQATIARFGSWGAVPEVFDERRQDWHSERVELVELLGRDSYEAARRTTLNAHFTDPAIVRPMWDTLNALGLKSGNILEPGSGMGTFIGLAPSRLRMTGVVLDPTSAELSSYLYPDATIRSEGFERTNLPLNYFDGAIGNVPFGNFKLHDRTHNAGDHAIHNHFIIKSLNLGPPHDDSVMMESSREEPWWTSRRMQDAGGVTAGRPSAPSSPATRRTGRWQSHPAQAATPSSR